MSYLLCNSYIRFGRNLYRHIVGNPMGTSCVPLISILFYIVTKKKSCEFSYQSDNQAGVIEAFNSTSMTF